MARIVDGVLLFDKPSGPSSNQVLQRVKRLLSARKAGHAGTLDPLATGLLPILLGEATKFACYLSDASKVYEATLLVGVTTSTGDLAGEILDQFPVRVTAQEVETVAASFRGSISQVPPMHSALKVNGVPLYELARRGQVVAREAREIRIDELVVGEVRGNEVDIRVRCSKGTYIRVLAEDIGKALGCGAALKYLRRVGVGPFKVSAAVNLDALEQANEADRLRFLLPIEAGLDHVPKVSLEPGEIGRLRNGQTIVVGYGRVPAGTVRLYDTAADLFIGLGESTAGTMKALRMISTSDASADNLVRRHEMS